MEVKINREIRDYTESMFFGLTLRQFIFSVLACGVAVGVYFLLRPLLGLETTSWVCILAAVPFAAIGFLKYNGMGFEKIIVQVADFYIGNQHRKIAYLPEETEIHDKVREIALSAAEKERKAELKQRKKDNKALIKKAEKIERRKRNARRNKRGNNGGNC